MRVRLFVIERSYGVRLVLTTRCRNLVPMASLTQDGQRYNRPLKFYPWDFGSSTQISYSAAVDLVAELGVPQFCIRYILCRYYSTIPIDKCKDRGEPIRMKLMMSSAS
ncbi:hypothetical protein M9H77_21965 [Catharanthus roseus]|uniref:Uncharacterized protein n=1 Tax=Catharanthus roseus TaxID=4058 RepID=A0ACC0ARM6_CATRO|nr:hypothetical protein M9H77_21965 [Catharanthus roseus]